MRPKENKRIISDEVQEMDISKYLEHQDFLGTLYARVKKQIASYSYLKFTEDLGFGYNNYMRLVIIGQRTLTLKAAERISSVIGLAGPRKRYFHAIVSFAATRDIAERDRLFSEMMKLKEKISPNPDFDQNLVRYIERWYLPIIREMVGLAVFKADPNWIQKNLCFPVHLKEVRYALKTLVELGLLIYDKNKDVYQKSSDKVHSPPELDSLAAVRFHQKMIDLGKESILRIPAEFREVVSQTVSIPVAAVPVLKRHIEKLLDSMEALEDGEGDCEVFQINVQLFPVTKSALGGKG